MQSKIRKYIIKSCPVGETKDVFVGKSNLSYKSPIFFLKLKNKQ